MVALSRQRSRANLLGARNSRIWTKPCARPLRALGPRLRPPSARIADGRRWAIAHPPRPSPGRSPSLRPPRRQSHRSSAPRSDAARSHSGRASTRLHRSPSPGTPGGAQPPTSRARRGDNGGNAPSRAGWRLGLTKSLPPPVRETSPLKPASHDHRQRIPGQAQPERLAVLAHHHRQHKSYHRRQLLLMSR